MPHSAAFLHAHVVFCVKYRLPWIQEDRAEQLYDFMGTLLLNKDCRLLEINGVEDHVYLLINFHPIQAPSKVIGHLKSNSSRFAKELFNQESFTWQRGYGAFSVSYSQIQTVRRYIQNQKEHHRRVSFSDEMRKLCEAHGFEPDERFLKGEPAHDP